LAFSLLLKLSGIPIVGYLSWRRKWKPAVSALGKPILTWAPRVAWPWANEEDGIDPSDLPSAWTAFKWSALRNGATNAIRFWRPAGFTIDPSRVRSVCNNRNLYVTPIPNGLQWSLTWHGPYAGLWIHINGVFQIRIGWSLVPADADGPINPADLRQVWCGFTSQINKG